MASAASILAKYPGAFPQRGAAQQDSVASDFPTRAASILAKYPGAFPQRGAAGQGYLPRSQDFTPEQLTATPYLKTMLTSIERGQPKLELTGQWEPPPQTEVKPSWFWRSISKLGTVNAAVAGATYAIQKGYSPEEVWRFTMQNAKEAWKGERPENIKYFKDVLVQAGMKDVKGEVDWVDVAGLALDVLADPTTYLGVGLVGKAGKGVKLLKGIEGAEKIAQAAKKFGVSAKAIEMAKVGKLAPTMAEQAKLEQRALVSFMGKPIVKGEGFYKVYEPAAMSLWTKVPGFRTVGKIFNKDIADDLWAIHSVESAERGYLAHGERSMIRADRKAMYARIALVRERDAKEIGEAVRSLGVKNIEDPIMSAAGVAMDFDGNLDEAKRIWQGYVKSGKYTEQTAGLTNGILKLWEANKDKLDELVKITRPQIEVREAELAKEGLLTTFVENYWPNKALENVPQPATGVKGWLKKHILRYSGDVALAKGSSFNKPRIIIEEAGGKTRRSTTLDMFAWGHYPQLNFAEVMLGRSRETTKVLYQHKFVKEVLADVGNPMQVSWLKNRKLLSIPHGYELMVPRSFIKSIPTQHMPKEFIGRELGHLEQVTPELLDKITEIEKTLQGEPLKIEAMYEGLKKSAIKAYETRLIGGMDRLLRSKVPIIRKDLTTNAARYLLKDSRRLLMEETTPAVGRR